MGLFVLLLLTSLILTDISSVYLAKRNLTAISEAVTQRAMRNLDRDSYYVGEYNLYRYQVDLINNLHTDPGIPIDCEAGYKDALATVESYSQSDLARGNLLDISLLDFHCDGFQVEVQLGARARMPVRIPITNQEFVPINSKSGAIGERSESNNFSGFDIG